jgi:CheY-like chemotaxis protein
MSSPRDSRVESRGTVLVVSKSRLFLDIVGAMVVDAGYTAAVAAQNEPVWRSLGRTQPDVVICDPDCPVQTLERLRAEAMTLGIPLFLCGTLHGSGATVLPGVPFLSLPATQVDFVAALTAPMVPQRAAQSGSRAVSGVTARRVARR